MSGPRPIAIVGPTASGKTALSIDLARAVDGEIISMDSRQVYRGMDIGTAKVAGAQRASVPHHGLDLVEPSERFSAGEFGRRAREWIGEIQDRRRVPILVGGTGFFLRALTNPIFSEPPMDAERREALRSWLDRHPTETLQRWLGALDAESAARLSSWGGRQRQMRALEVALLTGRTLPWWHRESPPEADPVSLAVFVLNLPREQLNAAIDRRVDDMVADGLLDEVRTLLERGYDESDPGMNATGYIELIPALRGEIPVAQALDEVRRNTRAYARRQLTWFRHQLPGDAVWLDATRPREEVVRELVRRWAVRGPESPVHGAEDG